MSLTVCLGAGTLNLLEAGGHMWFFLNWALGLREIGCRVIWLEQIDASAAQEDLLERATGLKRRLQPFGLAESIAFCSNENGARLDMALDGFMDGETACGADLLINLGGKIGPSAVSRFKRSAFVDIDPGIMQIWISESKQPLVRHDVYFSIGETVGNSEARFPSCGVDWQYTPTAIYLPAWPVTNPSNDAAYTTVSSWWGWWEVFNDETFNNEKRTTFLEYLEMPTRAAAKFELALALWEHRGHEDVRLLEEKGWSVKHAFDVGATPDQYRNYVAGSRGEFSCAKPSCMRLQNAWISDRSLCYMAMGKPAVVQHTGQSRFLPDANGLFRFRNLEQAVEMIEAAEADYERHGREARAFVEEYFDARKVVTSVLERALP